VSQEALVKRLHATRNGLRFRTLSKAYRVFTAYAEPACGRIVHCAQALILRSRHTNVTLFLL
jgi:hypothetical protein